MNIYIDILHELKKTHQINPDLAFWYESLKDIPNDIIFSVDDLLGDLPCTHEHYPHSLRYVILLKYIHKHPHINMDTLSWILHKIRLDLHNYQDCFVCNLMHINPSKLPSLK